MTPFAYQRPRSAAEAVAMLAASDRAGPLAGGTCLIDLMKQGVLAPTTIVDLNFAPDLADVAVLASGALRVGAMATLAHVARRPEVLAHWPLLHEAIVDGLTPQLRNAATFGGNILQRPRCIYFREPGFKCNKRVPGSGCAAQEGVHYAHAIFGGAAAAQCIAVHPSDLCVALTALDARIHIASAAGERVVAIVDLLRLPGDDPTHEASLGANELVVAVEVPAQGRRGGAYVKGSEGFTLASCAALIDLDGDVIRSAQIVFGGVAHRPWRAHPAEAALVGSPATSASIDKAMEAALAEATLDFQTAFRAPLLRGAAVQAVETAISRAKDRA